jgi:hypothetical protein
MSKPHDAAKINKIIVLAISHLLSPLVYHETFFLNDKRSHIIYACIQQTTSQL